MRIIPLFFMFIMAMPVQAQALINDSEPKTYEDLRRAQDLQRRFPQDIRLTFKALNGQPVLTDDKSVITFNKGSLRMSGFGGCNSVSADYRLSPRQMRFGPLSFTTTGKCSEAARKQEIAAFKAIQSATHWTPDGHNSITLHGKASKISFGPAF